MTERATIIAFGKMNGRHDFDQAESFWNTRSPSAKNRWRVAIDAAIESALKTIREENDHA